MVFCDTCDKGSGFSVGVKLRLIDQSSHLRELCLYLLPLALISYLNK